MYTRRLNGCNLIDETFHKLSDGLCSHRIFCFSLYISCTRILPNTVVHIRGFEFQKDM